MSTSLPERPDLDQLRRQAKELRDAARRGDQSALARLARHHRSAPGGEVSLAAAQLVIARELGFSSWPTLKATIDAATAAPDGRTHAFLAASIEGRLREATRLFEADPGLVERSLLVAVVLGETDSVRSRLTADPGAAVTVDDERGWPPLLYAATRGGIKSTRIEGPGWPKWSDSCSTPAPAPIPTMGRFATDTDRPSRDPWR